jgi:hypothetical protein
MLNTIYNYFTRGYQARLAHLTSHKSGIYGVKSQNSFMMDILDILLFGIYFNCAYV